MPKEEEKNLPIVQREETIVPRFKISCYLTLKCLNNNIIISIWVFGTESGASRPGAESERPAAAAVRCAAELLKCSVYGSIKASVAV